MSELVTWDFSEDFGNNYLPFLPHRKEVRLLRDQLLRKVRLIRTREPTLFFAQLNLRHASFLPALIVVQDPDAISHGIAKAA